MLTFRRLIRPWALFWSIAGLCVCTCAAETGGAAQPFPLPLSSYPAINHASVAQTLCDRIHAEPFNLVFTIIFALAILHTFLAFKIRQWAHTVEAKHAANGRTVMFDDEGDEVPEVSFGGQILHLLSEVEAVFGAWAVVLLLAITWHKGWSTAVDYVGHGVDFTEPLFVVVIMALASTRPILRFAERGLYLFATLGGNTIAASWLSILIIGPLLSSLITEPGAMTISALMLARQFYHYKPSLRFSYATIGLLFVNVSVGGTLTNFAAPPLLMAAGPWHWSSAYIFAHFGWKATLGIVTSTLLYFAIFRKELAGMENIRMENERFKTQGGGAFIPMWLIAAQVAFMAFVVLVAHSAPLFIGAFLFFLAFAQATAHYQKKLDLRPPLLVGFFLAGLVVHGGLQAWWIEPVLKSLGRVPLFISATILTSFNDNAAITYLATLAPGFTDALKHAVVAGAVTGGGLTVIANAPNPAGQAILQKFFPNGVSAVSLFVSALIPTLIMALAFMLL
jgi:hypothetical protein